MSAGPTRREPAASGAQRSPEPLAVRLRELARLLPDGATVSLDRGALERLAGSLGDDLGSSTSEPDLTVAEAAARLQLSANRVRALIGEGKLTGYRIGGVGGWRITAAALRRFREAGTPASLTPKVPADHVDLGRWRRSVGAGPNPIT